MPDGINSAQQIIGQDYTVSTDKSFSKPKFLPQKSESVKSTDSTQVARKYPGVTMSLQTLDRINEEAKLGAMAVPRSTSFKPVFNKAKTLVTELIEKTKKVDTQDVAVEAGMQIKDWYDSHKVSSS